MRRHSLVVRVTHAVSAACLCALLLSGFQIFNAHPSLYWGAASDFDRPLLSLTARPGPDGRLRGYTRVLGAEFETTGILGASAGEDGQRQRRGFPTWLTLPSSQWLAMGRRWHFCFAWALAATGLVYATHSVVTRHVRRDLLPTRADLRGVGRSAIDHALLRHPRGEAAARYNVLQRLSYLGVVFGLAPAMVVTGLAMSPRMDTVLGPLVDLAGGRQSMRTLHFAFTLALVAFFGIHVFEVLATGAANNLRSIVTGRFRIEPEREPADDRP